MPPSTSKYDCENILEADLYLYFEIKTNKFLVWQIPLLEPKTVDGEMTKRIFDEYGLKAASVSLGDHTNTRKRKRKRKRNYYRRKYNYSQCKRTTEVGLAL
jgi:hypothetical protein